MSDLEVTVPGTAVPQGSKRIVRGNRMIEANRDLRPWRACVASHVIAAIVRTERQTGHRFPLAGPVDLAVTFNFPRPKAHYRTGRFSEALRAVAPTYMQVGPDLDKLVRAIGDALTDACAIVDDKQLHVIHAAKRWTTDDPFTTITLWSEEK